MSKRKQTRAIQKVIYKLFRYLSKLVQTAVGFSQWLMRSFLILGRKQRRPANAKAGFVLPTVTLLLLVVSLVIGAILFRTGSRTNQVIGAREEQVIYNAATPAIERAKAKLEYLFLKDKRFPGGAPSDEMLLAMLTNEPQDYNNLTYKLNSNPYTFVDESQEPNTRDGYIDLNVDGKRDPAWAFQIDVDGDGTKEKVVYSIHLKGRDGNINIEDSREKEKASKLVVRNGPITTTNINNPVCRSLTQSTPSTPSSGTPVRAVNENDWYAVGSAKLRKTFQVDAIVLSNQSNRLRTVATLEFQQDRQLDRGNKWGAWFRYDLEIFPGQKFRWNGAMYTAGNLIVGDENFEGYLISSKGSCFYTKDASEIKVNRIENTPPNPETPNFQGLVVSGQIATDANRGGSLIHVMNPVNNEPIYDRGITLADGTDSNRDNSGSPPSKIALDPVILFTEDKSQARGEEPTNIPTTDTPFFTNTNANPGQLGYLSAKTNRITRGQETIPFVDDTYRADDRYGPKPYYGKIDDPNRILLGGSGKMNGDNIQPADQDKLTKNNVDALDTEYRSLGLDGYWERRAWKSGLRVIVGDRLELGNTFGWVNSSLNGDTDRDDPGEIDPLYPPRPGVVHADQQRRTLRDNLASVQGTVVYQAAPNGTTPGEEPIACIATTAHPGTGTQDSAFRNLDGTWNNTIDNSKNFRLARDERYAARSGVTTFYSDFFTGLGTNGWEYQAPPPLSTLRSGSWERALLNLANFAGHRNPGGESGAFPPTQASGEIYPNPYLAMWGNFSNLKRALESGNNSIADQTYIQSAACTLGMLAYNIQYFEGYNYGSSDAGNLGDVVTELQNLFKPTNTNKIEVTPGNPTATSPTPPKVTLKRGSVIVKQDVPVADLSPDDYIGLLPQAQQRLARLVVMKEQIARDRLYGFQTSPNTTNLFNPDEGITPGVTGDEIPLACDAARFTGLSNANDRNTLALLCPSRPKFPSVYYLFPTTSHGRKTPNASDQVNTQEPYISQADRISAIFNQVDPRDITLAPKDLGSWTLPVATSGDVDFRIEIPGGGQRWVSMLDNALYNGREMMTVRTLDIDLAQLREKAGPRDNFLPTSGIVYAFREDAVREDAISRPASSGWNSCNTERNLRTNTGCFMNADISRPQDPPVNSKNGISPKAVDYFPDPDRRPHGFRLRNGQRIDRGTNNPRGLTFVSDNPVYIQGDFNCHSPNGTCNQESRLEEFTNLLEADWGDFYDRTANDLNENFARPAGDTWRPVEILADSITILSNSFQEGNIAAGLQDSEDAARTGAIPDNRYSFRAMNGPRTTNPGQGWVREDGTTSSINLPIKISQNGNPFYCGSSAALPSGSPCQPGDLREYSVAPDGNTYRPLAGDYRNKINQASETRVNATLISGIVPSRKNQTYGGFHNFPRFIERWGGTTNLYISGSFMQLNFSTYGTGPFEQNAWQPNPGDPPDNGGQPLAFISYYAAPGRQWGYDIGLQYAPAGPVAQRFLQTPPQRSEFYRELPANDPYICLLRRRIDSNAPTECTQN